MPGTEAALQVIVNVDFSKVRAQVRDRAALITAKAALDVEAHAKARARVDTGFMRASIKAEQVSPLFWRVTGYARYTVYNEFGTRSMSAQPMFAPAAEIVRPEYILAMRTLLT